MTKRINLSLVDETLAKIEAIANERAVSVVDVLRQFVNLGLLAYEIEKDPNRELIIRENGKEKIVVLL